MDLREYEGHYVVVKCNSGKIFTGLADIYSYADDNASGVASLTIETIDGEMVEVYENEAESVGIIPANISFAEFFSSIRKVV